MAKWLIKKINDEQYLIKDAGDRRTVAMAKTAEGAEGICEFFCGDNWGWL